MNCTKVCPKARCCWALVVAASAASPQRALRRHKARRARKTRCCAPSFPPAAGPQPRALDREDEGSCAAGPGRAGGRAAELGGGHAGGAARREGEASEGEGRGRVSARDEGRGGARQVEPLLALAQRGGLLPASAARVSNAAAAWRAPHHVNLSRSAAVSFAFLQPPGPPTLRRRWHDGGNNSRRSAQRSRSRKKTPQSPASAAHITSAPRSRVIVRYRTCARARRAPVSAARPQPTAGEAPRGLKPSFLACIPDCRDAGLTRARLEEVAVAVVLPLHDLRSAGGFGEE